MNDANVATLMSKMVSVTGTVTYTATATSTVTGSFTKLNGSLNLSINQQSPISLPVFKSTSALTLSGNDGVTSVSLPALTSAASGLTTLNFAKATSVDLSALIAYDAAMTITTADAGTVDLSAFTNLTKVDGFAATVFDALTVVNASVLKAPLFAKGEVIADAVLDVDLPVWQSLSANSSFDKATKVVLPSVTPGTSAGATVTITNAFPKATYVHLIAAASTVTSATTASHVSVLSSSAKLVTLILGGTYSTVNISEGGDLTSLTLDGTALDVTVNATDLTTINIPYTAAAKGSLTVTGNADLTSLTASKVNALKGLDISANGKLASVSMAALLTSAASPIVNIAGNNLTIENIQLPNTTPAVAHKITSADFAPLATYIGAAAALVVAASDSVVVTADNVNQITSGVGVVDTTVDLTAAILDSADADTTLDVLPTVISNVIFEQLGGSTGNKEKFEILITDLHNTNDNLVQVGGSNVSLIPETGLDTYYDVAAWAASSGTATQLAAAGVTIAKYGKGQNTAVLKLLDLTGSVDAVYTLDAGPGAAVSIISSNASSLYEIATGLMSALNAGTATASKYYSVESTDGSVSGSDITFTATNRGSAAAAFALSFSAKKLSGTYPSGVASSTAMYYSSTASVVAGANVASSTSAYVTFEAVAGGAAGAKTVSMTGALATQLVAGGVNRGAGEAGDDETYTAATETVAAGNGDSVARKSVNYTSKLGS
jgi:hypothetical protein